MHFLVEEYRYLVSILVKRLRAVFFLVINGVVVTCRMRLGALLNEDLEVADLRETVNLAKGHENVFVALHEHQDQGNNQVERIYYLVQKIGLLYSRLLVSFFVELAQEVDDKVDVLSQMG